MVQRKVDPTQLRFLHAEGLSTAQMAERMGVSMFAIQSNCKSLGLPAPYRPRRGGRPTLVDREELARLHGAGVKLADIANQLGVTIGTIERHARALGLTRWQRATPENLSLWEACLDDGWSFEEIHRSHGVDVNTLRRYFPGRAWNKQHRAEMAHVWRQFNSPELTKNYAYQEKRVA